MMANTARHFAIDTRFKFLVVNYVKAARRERKVRRIGMVHARADNDGVLAPRRTSLPLPALKELRPDLTLPGGPNGLGMAPVRADAKSAA